MAYGSVYDQLINATSKGSPNFSFYSIPVMWALSVAPHLYAAFFLTGGKFTNLSPREFHGKVMRKENKTALEAKYLRSEAASQNGMENIGWFAAAIVAGNLAKLPSHELNSLAGLYLASRALFNVIYIVNTSENGSLLRTAAYFVGIFTKFTLFIRAGRALQ